MGEIVNLNKVRKARDKAATQAQAKANRARHGQTGRASCRESV